MNEITKGGRRGEHSGRPDDPVPPPPTLDGSEAREAFLAKVRARRQDAPYFVDHGGGFGGSTVVTGPTLRAGFILQSADDKRPEQLAENLNGAWAAGYEQASADEQASRGVWMQTVLDEAAKSYEDEKARSETLLASLEQIREILTRYLGEPSVVIAAAVRPEMRHWLTGQWSKPAPTVDTTATRVEPEPANG